MAAKEGRSTRQYLRVYGGNTSFGLDLSCNAVSAGEIGADNDEQELVPFCAGVKGVMLGQANIVHPPINAIFETNATTTGFHDLMATSAGTAFNICDAIGVQEAPTYGSWAFVAAQGVKKYAGYPSEITILSNIVFSAQPAGTMNYDECWGRVVHPLAAETAANTGTTNVVNNGAATALGGFMFYCLTSVDAGNVTLSIDDSSDGTTYGALSGATSGALTASKCGIVQLGTTATVKQYLRWQAAFAGGASTATFMLAFVRGG